MDKNEKSGQEVLFYWLSAKYRAGFQKVIMHGLEGDSFLRKPFLKKNLHMMIGFFQFFHIWLKYDYWLFLEVIDHAEFEYDH